MTTLDVIRAEFDEEPREVVRIMHHEQHVPLCHVAGALDVSEWTLRRWCRAWGLETRRAGYIRLEVEGRVQRCARELGYPDIASAITAMRQAGVRWNDIKSVLGCGDATLSRHLREAARGYYNLSDEGRRVKSETRTRLNAEGRCGRMPPLCYVIGGPECASRL